MNLTERVWKAVQGAPVVDLHTHLFAPQFQDLNLWGIDEMLTYHYLVAEVLRVEPISPEGFYSMPKSAQADLVWEALFVRNSPLSEATAGVTAVLTAFGLDPMAKNLGEARSFFSSRTHEGHLAEVLDKSGVRSLTMTNDPFDPAERKHWDAGAEPDPRFHTALRIDPLINDWENSRQHLEDEAPREFLERWIKRMKPRYLAVSLPPTFSYPEESHRVRLLDEAVLPACREHDLPFAMMIGVRRQVNSRLRSAGDGMGVADLANLERLAEANPDNRFLVTTLADANAQALCVVARKFGNVLPFGCWWFMNNPSLVERVTLMRLEMLGPTFVPQHSDARVLDQLIYKWQNSRRAIAYALTKRYEALELSGLPVTDAMIQRDAQELMGGLAAKWLKVTF